jgi:hypothetical protein
MSARVVRKERGMVIFEEKDGKSRKEKRLP